MPPTSGQLALLLLSILIFAIGGAASVVRWWDDHPRWRKTMRWCVTFGILIALIVLVWHSIARRQWLPLGDNFDSLIWMGLLLALFVVYVQRRKPLIGLDWFVMPLVVILLISAIVFGRNRYHAYVADTWLWVHVATAFLGGVGFAIAAASGAMYVIASRRLHRKAPVSPQLGSLERLEHLTMSSVTLGFALLTVGLITGVVRIVAAGEHTPLAKIILAGCAWVVYALVLHSPMNPSFRGRKAAVLSVVGFLLMIGTILAVLLLPAGGGGGGNS